MFAINLLYICRAVSGAFLSPVTPCVTVSYVRNLGLGKSRASKSLGKKDAKMVIGFEFENRELPVYHLG